MHVIPMILVVAQYTLNVKREKMYFLLQPEEFFVTRKECKENTTSYLQVRTALPLRTPKAIVLEGDAYSIC